MTRLFVAAQAYWANLEHRVEEHSDDRGATMVEYALVVGGIAVIITGLLTVFGTKIKSAFDNILP